MNPALNGEIQIRKRYAALSIYKPESEDREIVSRHSQEFVEMGAAGIAFHNVDPHRKFAGVGPGYKCFPG